MPDVHDPLSRITTFFCDVTAFHLQPFTLASGGKLFEISKIKGL